MISLILWIVIVIIVVILFFVEDSSLPVICICIAVGLVVSIPYGLKVKA